MRAGQARGRGALAPGKAQGSDCLVDDEPVAVLVDSVVDARVVQKPRRYPSMT